MRLPSLTLLATRLSAADAAKSTLQLANQQLLRVAASAPNANTRRNNETRGGRVIQVGLRVSF